MFIISSVILFMLDYKWIIKVDFNFSLIQRASLLSGSSFAFSVAQTLVVLLDDTLSCPNLANETYKWE